MTGPTVTASLIPVRCPRTAGFTLVELVTVILLLGILSVVALPRLSATSAFGSTAFHDEVVAALRYARKTAVSRRRLVCANIQPSTVVLTMAATNPASSCTSSALAGADGSADHARADDKLISGFTGPIYFQPSGIVTADGAGTAVTDFVINVAGASPVSVVGQTGYVH